MTESPRNSVLQVEDVSKMYKLGLVSTKSLAHDLNRWWHVARGKEDPYLRIGESNDRNVEGESDYVYALRDINFSVYEGEAVGIIGRNGAGKSTLLKLLSQVTKPTSGRIRVKGRIASLLEVGTGFHPELTGRENIFLNGAILGMRKKEIASKLDDIIAFSGVARYIDTPVKRYSSGMYVRLAFAVAAHLESEILIVDEVLAVGDAEFQKKCLGKMGEVSKGQGRTVLFVSHNMQAIKTLCDRAIFMQHGQIKNDGPAQLIVDKYLSGYDSLDTTKAYNANNFDKSVYLEKARCLNRSGEERYLFTADEPITIELSIRKSTSIRGVFFHFLLRNNEETTLLETDSKEAGYTQIDTTEEGIFKSHISIPARYLRSGKFHLSLGIASTQHDPFQIQSLESFMSFDVLADRTPRDNRRVALFSTILDWQHVQVS
jgi:lipopolysaccharide transport system ATP-binding protein